MTFPYIHKPDSKRRKKRPQNLEESLYVGDIHKERSAKGASDRLQMKGDGDLTTQKISTFFMNAP